MILFQVATETTDINVIYQFFVGLLAFSLAYLLLKQSKIFNNEKVNKLIAFSFALFAFGRTDIGNWLSYAIPEMSMYILTLLALIIAAGLIFPGFGNENIRNAIRAIVFFASVVIVAYLFIAPMLPKGMGVSIGFSIDPGTLLLIIIMVTFIGIIWWLLK